MMPTPIAGGMNDNHTSQLAERYNQAAATYRDLWAPVLRIAGRRLIRELVSTQTAPAGLIVDVGTGVGALMPDILTAFPGACVLGIDRSPGMLALAPRDPGMLHAVADARHLPLASGSADLVLLVFMLFHLQQPADGLREVRRVLRPGGRVGTITWAADFESNASRGLTACLDEHGATPPDPAVLARDEPMNTPEKMQNLLRANGFSAARAWTEELVDRMELEHLLQLKTRMGSDKARFDSLSPQSREKCLASARARMQTMTPDDFVSTGKVVYAVAS
jgi:ubiquinone/menaquinone biosynthesis C-methylase UbiE